MWVLIRECRQAVRDEKDLMRKLNQGMRENPSAAIGEPCVRGDAGPRWRLSSLQEAAVWLTFWVSVLIGVVAALPILNHPELEGLWFAVGGGASAATSAVGQAAFPKTERTLSDGPVPFYYDAPVQQTVGEAAGQFFRDFILGIVIDVAAETATAIIVIIFVLVIIGGEPARKKREELLQGFAKKKT